MASAIGGPPSPSAGAFRPRLRREVELDGATAELHDPATGNRLRLEPRLAALPALLDGSLGVGALVDQVVGRCAVAPQLVEGTLRRLLLLHLLDGAGDGIREAVIAARSAATAPPLLVPGARLGCGGSGACCRGFTLGPLDDDEIERLGELDTVRLPEQLREQPFLELREWTPSSRLVYLATPGGACCFLLPDQRCALHATFGAAAKPRFCRLFPVGAIRTLDGLRIYDRGECVSFPSVARQGLPMVDEVHGLVALLGQPPLHHPPWLPAPGLPCDHAHLLALQRRLDELVVAARGAAAALVQAVALVVDFAAGLAACPLAPGEPEGHVARLIDGPTVDLALPAIDDEEARQAVRRLGTGLARALAPAPGEEPADRPWREELGTLLGSLEEASAAPLPAAVDGLLRLSLRHQLFGAKITCRGSVAAGLLRAAVAHLVTVAAGRREAARLGEPLGPHHLGRGHALAHRLLRQEAALDVFVAEAGLAPAVAAAARRFAG